MDENLQELEWQTSLWTTLNQQETITSSLSLPFVFWYLILSGHSTRFYSYKLLSNIKTETGFSLQSFHLIKKNLQSKGSGFSKTRSTQIETHNNYGTIFGNIKKTQRHNKKYTHKTELDYKNTKFIDKLVTDTENFKSKLRNGRPEVAKDLRTLTTDFYNNLLHQNVESQKEKSMLESLKHETSSRKLTDTDFKVDDENKTDNEINFSDLLLENDALIDDAQIEETTKVQASETTEIGITGTTAIEGVEAIELGLAETTGIRAIEATEKRKMEPILTPSFMKHQNDDQQLDFNTLPSQDYVITY